jgi:hypothetical protein
VMLHCPEAQTPKRASEVAAEACHWSNGSGIGMKRILDGQGEAAHFHSRAWAANPALAERRAKSEGFARWTMARSQEASGAGAADIVVAAAVTAAVAAHCWDSTGGSCWESCTPGIVAVGSVRTEGCMAERPSW